MADQPFGDIPLFREIQRLLAAGGGPINLELAGQVASAIAVREGAESEPGADARRSYAEAVAEAAPLLAGYTRLPLDEPFQTELMTRTEWLRTTLKSWRWLLEHAAERFTGELAQGGPESTEEDPMQAALSQVGPLLMGIQVGTMLGHLAGETLGRYDLPVAREDDGKLFQVWRNVERLADDYGLARADLVAWLALRDAARHLVATSVPWATRYLRSLLIEVIDAIEIDVAELEGRIAQLQAMGFESFQEELGTDGSLPVAQTERHQRALDRLKAFTALCEGYAEHSAGVIAAQLGRDDRRISEGIARWKRSPGPGVAMLSSVLGISADRELETAGTTFCAAIVQLQSLTALNKVWEAPDNLPTFAEIKDPFTWIERVLSE